MKRHKKIPRGAPQKRVSDKIRVLRHEGEEPKQAVATAINMERAHRLRKGGRYIRKGSKRK